MHLNLRAPKRLLGWESHRLERRCPWRQWVDYFNVCMSNSWGSCPSQSSHIVRNLEFTPLARGHRATKYSLRSGCILKTGILSKSLCDEWWTLYLVLLLRIWQPDLRSEYSSLGKQTCPGEKTYSYKHLKLHNKIVSLPSNHPLVTQYCTFYHLL